MSRGSVGTNVIVGIQLIGLAINLLLGTQLVCFRPFDLYSGAPSSPTYRPIVLPDDEDDEWVRLDLASRQWSWYDVPVTTEFFDEWARTPLPATVYQNSVPFWALLGLPTVSLVLDLRGARSVLFREPTALGSRVLRIQEFGFSVGALWQIAVRLDRLLQGSGSRRALFASGLLLGALLWRRSKTAVMSALFVALVGLQSHSELESGPSRSMGPLCCAQALLVLVLARVVEWRTKLDIGVGLSCFMISMWYFSAGATKVGSAGLSWCDGNYLKLLVARCEYLPTLMGGPPTDLSALQQLLLGIPNWMRIVGMAAVLALELSAPLLWHPRTMWVYIMALVLFQVGSTITIGVPLRVSLDWF